LERLRAVTPQQITEVASRYLDPARMSVIVVGDLATVRPQLEAVKPLNLSGAP